MNFNFSFSIYYFLLYFFIYGFLGWCSEVSYAALKTHHFVNRGFLNGPICPIYGVGVSLVILFLTPLKYNLILLYIASVVLVTVLEGLTGWIMDIIFHNKWWDYSDIPFNIGGYVCLIFSIIWGIACVIIVDFIHPIVAFLVSYLPFVAGVVILIFFISICLSDTIVTSSSIFKFNKRLARMEKLAIELHNISDNIGEDIFEKTIRAIELQEKTQDAAGELKEKTVLAAENIKERTQGAAENIKERTQGAAENIKERTQGAAENIKERTQGAAESIKERTQGAAESLKERTALAADGIKDRKQDLSDEVFEQIRELQTKYRTLSQTPDKISARLVQAFPKLESHPYKEQLLEFKKNIYNRKK